MRSTFSAWIASIAMAFVLSGFVAGEQPAQKKPDAKKSIFDEKADAKADIKAALHSASRENRRVLIQWGRNACDSCLQLNETMRTHAALRKVLLDEYVAVRVDVGESGKRNADLAAQYKVPNSVPILTILDSSDLPMQSTGSISGNPFTSYGSRATDVVGSVGVSLPKNNALFRWFFDGPSVRCSGITMRKLKFPVLFDRSEAAH